MKKLILTTAIILAACGNANAANPPSLGEHIKATWDQNVDRSSWSDPIRNEPAFPVAGSGQAHADDDMVMHKGKKHGKKHAKKAAAAAKMTPEEKAKLKAERKAKWDAMTPEQKAAWKAKHPKKTK